jgi:colanic acid/amylovoran biosynthesis protein
LDSGRINFASRGEYHPVGPTATDGGGFGRSPIDTGGSADLPQPEGCGLTQEAVVKEWARCRFEFMNFAPSLPNSWKKGRNIVLSKVSPIPVTRGALILHGNNFDCNRGCQALRLTTQMILDRYLPDHPRLYANIFCNDDPQFHTIEPDGKSRGQIWETRRRGAVGFYGWGAMVVTARLWRQFPPMRVNRRSKDAAAVLALGGDNLSYDYGFLASLLFFSPLAAAVGRRIPAVVWGASIGPFSSRPYWEKRFADVLRRVDLITVREPITQDYLHGLGIRDNIRRVTDSAFLLPAEPTRLPDEIEQALEAGAIGINLAPLMIRYNRMSSRNWFTQARDMVLAVHNNARLPIVLIPHVMMPPHVFPDNDDFEFLHALRESLPAEARNEILLYDARNDSCKQIKWVISRLRVFAGARTHATIAALSSGVPTFCVGYSIKAQGLNREIFGHEQWVAHVSQLTAGRLAERIQDLLSAETAVRSHLRSFMPTYSEQAWCGGEYLQQLLLQRAGVV